MARYIALADGALSPPVYRAPFIRDLELDDRQEHPVGPEATWPQYGNHAPHYAAWVDGGLDADVEAIKRSMYLIEAGKESSARTTERGKRPLSDDQGSSIRGSLAVNLPVEELIYVPSLHAAALVNGLAPELSDCFDEENLG